MQRKIEEGFVGQKMIVLPPKTIRALSKQELTKRFYLTAVGYYPHAAFHNRERTEGCAQHIMLYSLGGKGNIYIDHVEHQLAANHFFIIPKNTPHCYSASANDPWTLYWLHFVGADADLMLHQSESLLKPIFHAYDPEAADELSSIIELLEGGFQPKTLEVVNIKVRHYIAGFVYAEQLNPSMKERDKMDESIRFMKAHIGGSFTVKQLAKQQHLSFTHYTRLFKAKTGSSPNQYFSELKIQKACQYLYFTDLSIKEICLRLGFVDPYYFSRLFKKLMGISPNHYRSIEKKQ